MDQSTNPNIRTGRCWGCQIPARRGRPARAAVYQWAYKKGRRLADAYCPACGGPLTQTTAANLKHYHLGQRTPIFTDSQEDALKELRERLEAEGRRSGAYTGALENEDEGIQRATSGQLKALGREWE